MLKTFIKIIFVVIIILVVVYILLSHTSYLDFIKKWPLLGSRLCCITFLEKTYRNDTYHFEFKYPGDMVVDTDSKDLREHIDEFNPFKMRVGEVLISVLKRKNRPDAICLREGDLKDFTACLLRSPRFGADVATYTKNYNGLEFIYQNYGVVEQLNIRRIFTDAYVATSDFIYQFESAGTKEKQKFLDVLVETFKITEPVTPKGSSQKESKYVEEKNLALVSQVSVVSIKKKDGTPIVNLPSPLNFKMKIDSNLLIKQGFSPADKWKARVYFWDNSLLKYELIGGMLNPADDNVETKINKTGTYVLGIVK